jgi:hypothetical protein
MGPSSFQLSSGTLRESWKMCGIVDIGTTTESCADQKMTYLLNPRGYLDILISRCLVFCSPGTNHFIDDCRLLGQMGKCIYLNFALLWKASCQNGPVIVFTIHLVSVVDQLMLF